MRKLFLLLILFSVAQQIQAQTSPTFDSTWASQFQTTLDNLVSNSTIVGAAAAVYAPGQGLWVGTSGNSYAAHPITPDMRFGIGSNTKLFVAVTMLKLQELGVLALDDHLGKWVGSFQNIDTSVTIRQMLSHQTGFYDFFNDTNMLIDSCYADPNRFWTSEEVLATIGPPHFSPGDAFFYSSSNYLLAGLVIEAATGQTLEQNLHQYILDPLNMDSTFLGGYETPNGPVAHEWTYNGEDLGDVPNEAFYSMARGAGYIYSTLSEMAQWYMHLFNGDIISEASLQQITAFEPSSGYGLGLAKGEWPIGYGNVFYIHAGLTLGYWTFMAYDVKRHTVDIEFTTGANDGGFFYPQQSTLYSHYPKQGNDAGITSIISPAENICAAIDSPIVTLKNFGSSVLNSVDINYIIDGGAPVTYAWSGSLDTSGSVNVSLPEITVGNGTHSFTCYTSNPNTSAEGYSFNDTISVSFVTDIMTALTAPYSEDFSSGTFPPEGWITTNDPNWNWEATDLISPLKRPAAVKCNYSDGHLGYHFDLCMPMLDISGLTFPELSFDYSYALSYSADVMQIMISSDCGATYQFLFNKYGAELETTPFFHGDPYFPINAWDWKHTDISLEGYSGDVLIKFRDISGGGNNLWLDNISVGEGTGIANVDAHNDVSVFPNPFESSTTILLNQPLHNANLILYDLLGNVVERINNINARSIDIERDGLPMGIYVFTLIEDGQTVARGRITAQ